jgi:phospholipase C
LFSRPTLRLHREAWNGGKMDNWLPAHRAADGNANGPFTMGYYERARY